MAAPDRWAPWIEPRADGNATINVFGTGWVIVPNCTVTFTPHINCRISVPVKADVTLAGAGAGVLNLQVWINGVGTGSLKTLAYQTATLGDRVPISEVFNYDLTGLTTYTIDLRASVSAIGATYTITGNNGRSGLGPILALPNLHS